MPIALTDRQKRVLEHHGPIDWSKTYESIEEIIQAASEAAAKLPRCQKAPEGWRCSGFVGHPGACAAWPDTLWLKIKWAWKLKNLNILVRRS